MSARPPRVVHILAHFDDEYCALPLIMNRHAAGADQHFLFMADYARPDAARRRLEETRAQIRRLGIDPKRVRHVGAGTGALDGQVWRNLGVAREALADALNDIGPADELVVTAWEGGHADHDGCAALAVKLWQDAGARAALRQVSLYHGRQTPGVLFRGGSPIPENGPHSRVPLTPRQWRRFATAVGAYPSQLHVWSTLWPAMFASFLRHGFRYQDLDPARVLKRPHAGPLLYERMRRARYDEVAERVQDLFGPSCAVSGTAP